MANISLEGSIRTCKIDSGWADKLYSDRFLNPSNMLCPPWNGVDTSGRPVCSDSFQTKTPGCNSASDRVIVENALRPQYIEYVTLDAEGIKGGRQCPGRNSAANPDSVCGRNQVNQAHQFTGQYGLNTGFSQNIYPNCPTCRNVPDRMAYQSNSMRQNQWGKQAERVHKNKKSSGFFW
ncbi:hypothetical protein OAV62_02190 [bacterium]|nr:hypothetical protein [bacterium]